MEVTEIIAIYAAIVATAALGWNVYSSLVNQKANIVCTPCLYHTGPYSFLIIEIANRGRKKVTISDMMFAASEDFNDDLFFHGPDNLPICLDSTDIHKIDTVISSFGDWSRIRCFKVYDSTGKCWVTSFDDKLVDEIEEAYYEAKENQVSALVSYKDAQKQHGSLFRNRQAA